MPDRSADDHQTLECAASAAAALGGRMPAITAGNGSQ
jgi:hypothetical protein